MTDKTDPQAAHHSESEAGPIQPPDQSSRLEATSGSEGGGPAVGYGAHPQAEPPMTFTPERLRRTTQTRIREQAAMRFIPTIAHGFLDYIMGALLIAAPWMLGFAEGGPETWTAATWVPVVIGAGIILQSMITAYECGVVGLISMKTHLAVDIAAGIILAASPWLFGFWEAVWGPHLILGIGAICGGLMTKTIPASVPRTTGARHAGA